jgi:hypothetical protein
MMRLFFTLFLMDDKGVYCVVVSSLIRELLTRVQFLVDVLGLFSFE